MPLWRLMHNVNNSRSRPAGSDRCRIVVRLLFTLASCVLAGCSNEEKASAPLGVRGLKDSHQTRPRPKETGSRRHPLTPVTHERLLKGTDGGQDWLMYGGNYQSWRYSPLQDVNRQNVSRLRVAWSFATGVRGKKFETSPLVIDSLLYLTTADNQLVALDAATGELVWSYKHPLPDDLRLCCGPVNRGAAAAGDNVFMATLDARLVALNRGTGEVAWDVKINEYALGYSATMAPLVVKDKVFVGVAGGETAPGHIDAYNAQTGELLWRRYTVPAAGEKGVETWAGDSGRTAADRSGNGLVRPGTGPSLLGHREPFADLERRCAPG